MFSYVEFAEKHETKAIPQSETWLEGSWIAETHENITIPQSVTRLERSGIAEKHEIKAIPQSITRFEGNQIAENEKNREVPPFRYFYILIFLRRCKKTQDIKMLQDIEMLEYELLNMISGVSVWRL